MRVLTLWGITLALIVGIEGVAPKVTKAVQLRDGTVYFVQPPDLVNATTTFSGVNAWGATYYFTINIPTQAGEPLGRVTIIQHEGADNVHFKLDDSRAFVGTRNQKGARLSLAQVTQERKKQTVVLNFDPPVTPGQTITIGLRPVQNPRISGVYLFGVTAFPWGEKSHGQFLGYGRLQFYGGRRLFGFP